MRSSLLASALAHVAVLVALFWVRTPVRLFVPGPETVQVQLVDLSRLPAAPAPAKPAPPEQAELNVKPILNETGVKLVTPAKPKKPADAKPAEAAASAPQLPSEAVGNAGLRGDVSVDAANFEFTYYLLVIRNRIASVWAPPAGLVTGGQAVRARVFFRIARNGAITEIRLEQGSGLSFFDQSALRAVTLAHPMPPLPIGFTSPDLGVHFGFEYDQ